MIKVEITNDGEILWGEKDKDARLNYSFDMSQVLSADDPLESLTFTVTPPGAMAVDSYLFSGNEIRVVLTGGVQLTWYAIAFKWQSASGLSDQFVLRMFVPQDAETVPIMGFGLFPNRFTATARLRKERILLAAATIFPSVDVTDDYLWSKILAAQSEVSHDLRVFLVPTQLFPTDPTDDQITALNGMPYEVDPGQDYSPDMFAGERWGGFKARHHPIIDIQSFKYIYPSAQNTVFDVPLTWLRVDKKYGMVNMVPTSSAFSAPLTAFVAQSMSYGRGIPLMLQLTYTAGLVNAAQDYPELVDVIYKKAALKIIEDAFLPQSGSISADGLSQSMSVDMEKYHDSIDRILNGGKGSNGGLMTAIHGIRVGVLGN